MTGNMKQLPANVDRWFIQLSPAASKTQMTESRSTFPEEGLEPDVT